MSEKVKILSQRDVEVTLFNAMCEDTKGCDLLEKFSITPEGSGVTVDVKVTVNGVEVPFMETMSGVFAEFNWHVTNEAKKLVEDYIKGQEWAALQDKVCEINSGLDDLNRDVQRELEKMWIKS